MRKKGKEKEPEKKDTANPYILNLITPSGIDVSDNHADMGDGHGRIYAITKYPAMAGYGWLAALCNLEGTTTVIEYRYSTPDVMLKAFDTRISELKQNHEMAKKESEKKVYAKAIDDLENMIKRISVNNEPVGYFNVMLHIQDMRYPDLEQRIKKINGLVAVEECNMRLLRFKQYDALKSISPYYKPTRLVSNIGGRNMPMGTFTGGFPMAAAGINDPGGYLLGKTKNMCVILNMWLRSKDRTNSNWFISGVPGVGKSSFIKLLLLMEYAVNDTRQFIWDAENEYTDLCRHSWVNGDIIDCASGSTGRINPLQVRKAPRITQEDLDPDENIEDYLIYDDSAGVSDVALHIQSLRMFFTIYFGKKAMEDPGLRMALENCLIETYKKFGIELDTDVSKFKAEDYPIMSDLYDTALDYSKDHSLSERKREVYEKLAEYLFSAAKGADQYLWNGYTTLKPKSRFTVLNTSKLQEMDDNVKNAQYYNLQLFTWHEMSKDRTEKCLNTVDEGYLFVDPENPMLMKFFRNVSKRDRKYEAGLTFITHAPADVLDPAVKRFGQAIIDNSCYKMIMGCDAKNLAETCELFHLSDKEELLLSSKTRGTGILFAGNVRLELKVDIREKFLEIFGTAGGR